MTDSEELQEIVQQQMEGPFVLGRLATRLRKNETVKQCHKDQTDLQTVWRNTGSFWRCTVFLNHSTEDCLAQVDLHNDGTVRVELFEPCSVTIDPAEDLMVLTRYAPRSAQEAP
jgi:hypothetical protein